MRKTVFALFLLNAVICFSQNRVPLGSNGNRLSFSVSNRGFETLQEVRVRIESCPSFTHFDRMECLIETIRPAETGITEFSFSVEQGAAGVHGSIHLAVSEKSGRMLASKDIALVTCLETAGSGLSAAYPNPGNPEFFIPFSIPEQGQVRLEIVNAIGRRIRTLVNEQKPAGLWTVKWDGRDDRGIMAATGVYLVRFQSVMRGKSSQSTSKILLSK